jgi:hypothetical protein
MITVFKVEDQIKFIYTDGDCRDGFILQFGDDANQDLGKGIDTIDLTEGTQKSLIKWLINHMD